MKPPSVSRVPGTVIALGIASLFTDVASEMIYPLLPAFLSAVLGAGALALGVIEGVAEATAALLKLFSGRWSDRLRRRKPMVLAGYGIAGLARPLIGLATSWTFVLLIRFVDRIGKGIRTSPRDALISDVTPKALLGSAFGLHRSLDHAGAVLGPLVAAGLLVWGFSYRDVFFAAAVPAVVVIVILFFIREREREVSIEAPPALGRDLSRLGPQFRTLLLAVALFTLGNSSDAFLLLRLTEAGVPVAWVAVLWSTHHVVKSVAVYFGGRLSDRVGRRRMLLGGWAIYALTYLAFASINSTEGLIAVFIAYGLYFGFVEPNERAWVSELAPAGLRGTAFGYFHAVVGMMALPASALFGVVWYAMGAPAAFVMGAALAALAALILFIAIRPSEVDGR